MGKLTSAEPQQSIDGLVQQKRNSSGLAVELGFSCTNPSIWTVCQVGYSLAQVLWWSTSKLPQAPSPDSTNRAWGQIWLFCIGICKTVCTECVNQSNTRTTRMPAFWRYPLPPHDYPYYWFILDPKSKEDKVKVANLKNLTKLKIF